MFIKRPTDSKKVDAVKVAHATPRAERERRIRGRRSKKRTTNVTDATGIREYPKIDVVLYKSIPSP